MASGHLKPPSDAKWLNPSRHRPGDTMEAPRREDIEAIVRESAGRVRSAHGFTVATKGSRENLVTSADIENEAFLKSRLTDLLPGSAFIGEEGDEASLRDSEWAWIVDPIDGTANFSRGIPMCAVSVALFRDAEPYAGFVINPFTDTLYSAVAGEGATRDGEAIRVSDRALEDCILSTAWCCYGKELAPPVFRVSEALYPEINDIRRIGTAALELSLIAEGAVDMYFEIRLSPWDYAAGLTILREAGGCYTGIGDGDVSFEGPSPVLAANSGRNLGTLKAVVDREFDGKVPYRIRVGRTSLSSTERIHPPCLRRKALESAAAGTSSDRCAPAWAGSPPTR